MDYQDGTATDRQSQSIQPPKTAPRQASGSDEKQQPRQSDPTTREGRRFGRRSIEADQKPYEISPPTREGPGSPASMLPAYFPSLSPGATDRVFPIRSVVSVDPNSTPLARGNAGDGFPGLSGPLSDVGSTLRRSSTRRSSDARTSSTGGYSDSGRAETPASLNGGVPASYSEREQRTIYERRSDMQSITSRGVIESGQMNVTSDDFDARSEGGASTDGRASVRSRVTTGHQSVGDSSDLFTTARYDQSLKFPLIS